MLDTRELITERDDHKQQILDSFLDTFFPYEGMADSFEDICFEEEEIESWKEEWMDELNAIREIDELEENIEKGEWDFGTTLIPKWDFQNYCENFVMGSYDLPALVENNIDWSGVSEDMKQDYSEVIFRGTDYLYRLL